MSRRRRDMTREEDLLWRHVIRDVAPLPGHTPPPVVSAPKTNQERPAPSPMKSAAPPAPPLERSAAAFHVDRGLERRIRRGLAPIEGRIDLHGMTQDEAYRVLLARLSAAAQGGKRCILVITGKGLRLEGFGALSEDAGRADDLRWTDVERGVLRRRFQDWVRTPPLSTLVLGVREAHGRHGGSGAFYTFLRRAARAR